MPSTSKKQAALMRAVSHNKEFAKKVGIPQSVGAEFEAADKAKAGNNKSVKTMATKRYGRD